MTVGELMDVLQNYDKDSKVWLAVGKNKYQSDVAIRMSKFDFEIVNNDIVICGSKKG